MNRLHMTPVDEATGELAHLYAAIRRAIGKVPNVYVALGSNSPELLGQILQLGNMLQTKSELSRREIEAVNLAVSEDSGCDYCVAAHTLAGKAAGFTAEQTHALRNGHYPEDPRLDALVKFANRVVDGRGTLPAASFDEFRDQGFSDRQIVGTIGVISAIFFTNMLNRVNDTVVDFPNPD